LPVKAVAAAFKAGFEAALRASEPGLHAVVPDATWRADWNVDVKPAGNGTEVVRYLARYVKRTAISDERIIAADDKSVRFGYTDSVTREPRELELDADDGARQRGDGAARSEAEGELSRVPALAGGEVNNLCAGICATCHRRASTASGILAGCTRRRSFGA
jgi:hypothetical protein